MTPRASERTFAASINVLLRSEIERGSNADDADFFELRPNLFNAGNLVFFRSMIEENVQFTTVFPKD